MIEYLHSTKVKLELKDHIIIESELKKVLEIILSHVLKP